MHLPPFYDLQTLIAELILFDHAGNQLRPLLTCANHQQISYSPNCFL